ncbi:MAG TPA: tetratricopeptide repeat protein [Opitutaceae bacterium]|nr:tetratricopeptide repeat protein [Opitutaceae bacterium]
MAYPVRFLVLPALLALAGCATNPGSPAPAAAASATATASKPQPLDEDRLREAQMLKDEGRLLEAAAIYAEQAKLQPGNAWLVARQAQLLDAQARLEADPAKAKTLAKRARALAEQAEKLGTDDPLTPLILQSIRPDGSRAELKAGDFSKHEEADRLIREGEAAFGRHDFTKARECYQKAAELEPTNYMATLWTGDTYFAARELESACTWFRKATAIAPDNETAHRYLADALAKLGRREEALNEHIAAVLCEPYQRVTRQHFTAELRSVAEAKGHRIPRFPAMQSKIEKDEIKIVVGPDTGPLFLAYNIGAMRWRKESFSSHFPEEKAQRRSLPEEIDAIGLMLTVAAEAGSKGSAPDEIGLKTWQPTLDALAVLKRDGLLEAYALLERADEELAKDYAAYRGEHRDKLERYIRVYWCGFD